MNKALNALYALQQVDSALAVAHRRYQALDPGRAEQAASESARVVYDRTAHEQSETTRDLHDAELELRTVEAKKKEFETKLYSGKVQAFKELESIQQEIEALGRQRGRLDERILTLMDQLETRKAAEAEAKRTAAAADAALVARQAEYKETARKLAGQIRALTEQRNQMAAGVAPALLKRYETLQKSRGGVAIGRIEDSRCGACHTSLPADVVRAVEDTDSVEVCENCGRLLCTGEPV